MRSIDLWDMFLQMNQFFEGVLLQALWRQIWFLVQLQQQ